LYFAFKTFYFEAVIQHFGFIMSYINQKVNAFSVLFRLIIYLKLYQNLGIDYVYIHGRNYSNENYTGFHGQ